MSFNEPEIKGVIATLRGDDQVTYIKNLPKDIFINNPKPFYGFSDNTHFANFLWLCCIPSFYGASLFTQFSMPRKLTILQMNISKNVYLNQLR
jgi:muramoyltetrapeptide carboxypeptidase LdcA involved in peptidoglycan recycling